MVQFNFQRKNLSHYLRLPTRKVRVYMLFRASNDAILRLFGRTDSGMVRDENRLKLKPGLDADFRVRCEKGGDAETALGKWAIPPG